MKPRPTNAQVVTENSQRINGLNKFVPPTTVIPMNGKTIAAADAVAVYQRTLDARATVRAKLAELKAALAERRAADGVRREVDQALKSFVVHRFGPESEEAHEFGYPPPRKTPLTVEQKVHSVALGAATRKARHTMGKREKLAIKGVLPDEPPPPETPSS